MNTPQKLLTRLDEIGRAVAATGKALAVIGLGSVGLERQRLDEFSDLDFFVIVQAGQKQGFIEDLSWLSAPAPLAYAFRNSVDGYKALYEDGIFCEFAVFEEAELSHIPFAEGLFVWKHPNAAEDLRRPKLPAPQPHHHSTEWLLGELLTNLYVGTARYQRGEKLSAMRFVQSYAVDRLIDLLARKGQNGADVFSPKRRLEVREPDLAALLPSFLQGYERTPESALALLTFVESRWPVNAALKQRIVALCG
jgi:hypothetical protein